MGRTKPGTHQRPVDPGRVPAGPAGRRRVQLDARIQPGCERSLRLQVSERQGRQLRPVPGALRGVPDRVSGRGPHPGWHRLQERVEHVWHRPGHHDPPQRLFRPHLRGDPRGPAAHVQGRLRAQPRGQRRAERLHERPVRHLLGRRLLARLRAEPARHLRLLHLERRCEERGPGAQPKPGTLRPGHLAGGQPAHLEPGRPPGERVPPPLQGRGQRDQGREPGLVRVG